jgi:hypothetical protein
MAASVRACYVSAGPIHRRRKARSSVLDLGGSDGATTMDWIIRRRNSTRPLTIESF